MASSVAPSLLLCLLLLLRPVPAVAHSVSLSAAFLEDVAGSGEAEGSSASSPSLPPPPAPAPSATSAAGPRPTARGARPPPASLLEGIADFFRQHAMLLAVVGSLTFLLLFIVCAALITRQRHKATAYYPSSFPRKKYVDQSDRAGGPRAFSEVPDRAPDGRPEEALDSSQQLRADILAATQNLKSPARAAPGSGEGAGPGDSEPGAEAGSLQVAAVAPEVPAERPEAPAEPRPAQAEGTLAASEGPGQPEGPFSPAREAPGPAGPPEGPCACSSVSPSD
ncbi:transmembrane protein 119 [Marmota flaviventris]|uniref:transmembrane protein 119 n=1 Tax=Marmota flaviventris TaxID=93162 RepID=UPI000FFF9FF5|nr:transmembrane protein 119 [Marmota flaviventris]